MVSFGSDSEDIDCTDTEVFDGQLSPPSCSGEDTDKGSYSSGRVHLYDDQFETQVVNLAGETQVVNLAGETQVMSHVNDEFETQLVNPLEETQVFDFAYETQILNLCGETQQLDDIVSDCIKNMDYDTQVLNDFDDEVAGDCYDDEGTETTEINADVDLSGDESAQSFDQSVDREKGQLTSLRKNDVTKDLEVPSDKLPDKKSNSVTRLASIRAASLRASGLAARNFALSTRNPGFSSVMNDKDVEKSSLNDNHVDRQTDLGQCCENDGNSGLTRLASTRAASLRASGVAARSSALLTRNPGSSSVMNDKDTEKSSLKDNQVDRQSNLGQCHENDGDSGGIRCRVGSSAVRKLFTEDYIPVGDFEDLHTSHDVGDINPHQLTACDGDQLVGLSYVDSQEPGDLTQDNALDFVEKFLKDNSLEFDQGGGSTRKLDVMVQTNSVISPKGQYKLANIVNCVRTNGESRAFDWDDNREDEGGGDLFCRRKEEFFTEPRKLKRKGPDLNGDKETSLSTQNMKSRLFCSDSRLELSKEKENKESAQEANVQCKKNLYDKLDQQKDGDACSGELEDNNMEPDQQEVINVGFDTQMAAEAIESLFNGENINKLVNNEANQHLENSPKHSFRGSTTGKPDSSSNLRRSSKRGQASSSGVILRQSKKRSHKVSGNLMKACENKTVKMSEDGKKTDADGISRNENIGRVSRNRCSMVQKRLLRGKVVEVSPVARRTRHSVIVNQSKKAKIAFGGCEQSVSKVGSVIKKRSGNHTPRDSNGKRTKSPEAVSETISTKSKKGTSNNATIGEQSSSDVLVGQVSLADQFLGQTVNRCKRSCNTRKTRSSLRVLSLLALNEDLERPIFGTGAEQAHGGSITADMNGQASIEDSNGTNAVLQSNEKNDGYMVSSVVKTTLDKCPSKSRKPSDMFCSTPPDNCTTPVNDVSPVCMGSEYYKQSCKKSPSKTSLLKELRDLTATGLVPGSLSTESRKRKDMNDVRILYSQHLDENIIKQQKKTLTRLGVTVASSMTEATHFIADKFVRTRNMLEAIAMGKLVVTHLWIESCGQASCFLDEKNYILRDAKKEKEFGFSLPGSLASARQKSLLEGRRVLITPNTKPGKNVISSLIKAVKGQAIERIGRSMLKDDQIPDDLLILSCEEDYDMCIPFLEKGAAVYSSELLFNGIVTQKLEFERHRLFVDHVKRTRSTIWLKKDGNKFHPVSKHQ